MHLVDPELLLLLALPSTLCSVVKSNLESLVVIAIHVATTSFLFVEGKKKSQIQGHKHFFSPIVRENKLKSTLGHLEWIPEAGMVFR